MEAHGDGHSWLDPTLEVFQTLKLDLSTHMVSEEKRIFPLIRALEEEASDAFLDENGIDKMIREHDDSGVALNRLREPTNDYAPPESACPKFRSALKGLHDLEADIYQHVHKENNILFPRARTRA